MASVFNLGDKLAIVTGAAGGIGAGIATALAEAGATVVLADINLAGVEQQGIRPPAPPFGQRRGGGGMHRIGSADAVLDNIRDLALDALFAGGLVDDGVAIGLDQLGLGHTGFGAFDKARHPSKQAARLCFRLRHRGLLRVIILTSILCGPSLGFLSLLPAALTTLGLTGRQVLRGHNGPAGAPAQKGHQPSIGHDQTDQ